MKQYHPMSHPSHPSQVWSAVPTSPAPHRTPREPRLPSEAPGGGGSTTSLLSTISPPTPTNFPGILRGYFPKPISPKDLPKIAAKGNGPFRPPNGQKRAQKGHDTGQKTSKGGLNWSPFRTPKDLSGPYNERIMRILEAGASALQEPGRRDFMPNRKRTGGRCRTQLSYSVTVTMNVVTQRKMNLSAMPASHRMT